MSMELKSRVFIIVWQARAEPSGKVFTYMHSVCQWLFGANKRLFEKHFTPLFLSLYFKLMSMQMSQQERKSELGLTLLSLLSL